MASLVDEVDQAIVSARWEILIVEGLSRGLSVWEMDLPVMSPVSPMLSKLA